MIRGRKGKKGFLGKKIILLYTDDLKNIHTNKSEVIVILRRVFPPVADSPRS